MRRSRRILLTAVLAAFALSPLEIGVMVSSARATVFQDAGNAIAGPIVLANGTVGGVVFAASTTDDEVGYAIAAGEVAPRVQQVVGTSREVDTGPCV